MIQMEDWVTIRNLKKKNQSLGTRTIADMLGISRNTVKKALASDEAPQYNRGERKINEAVVPFVNSRIQPISAILIERI